MKTQDLIPLAACFLLGAQYQNPDSKNHGGTELEGTWRAVSFVTKGESMPKDSACFHTTTFAGKTCIDRYGEKAGPKCTFEIDAKAKPKKLDVTIQEGKDKGKTILAIYELEGNTLRICEAALGKERPTGFNSTWQNQQCLEVLKRE